MDKSFRIIIVCVLMSFLFGGVAFGHMQEQFLRANNYVIEGDYAAALTLYDTLDQAAYGVHFNRAYCLHQMGRHADALVALKKAERFARAEQLYAVFDLLEKIYTALDYHVPVTQYDRIVKVVAPYVSYVPMLFWQCVWILLLLMLCGVLLCLRGYMRAILLLFFIVVIVLISAILMVKKSMRMVDVAVIVEERTFLYNGPNEQYGSIMPVPLGSQVVTLQHKDNWLKVRHAQVTGWMPSHVVSET